MFSSFSLPFGRWRSEGRRSSARIAVQPVKAYNVETDADKRARALKHLLKANHANYSVLWNQLRFHNHCPHILGSAFIFGGTPENLKTIYDAEASEMDRWEDSPGEISLEDWRDYLGKKEYQRAFLDFFEDQLVEYGYDWKKVVEHFLYDGKEPLINCMVAGLAHPLIHLGYGFELLSPIVAMEALTMTSCCYNELHKYLDDPSYTRPSSYESDTTLSIFQHIANDQRLDNVRYAGEGAESIDDVLNKKENIVLEHWNAWTVHSSSSPQKLIAAFEEMQRTAVALVVATNHPRGHKEGKGNYDFFIMHLLTSSHALRISLPLVRPEFHVSLVRQWLLFAIMAYIGQGRPAIDMSMINDFDLGEHTGDNGWKYVKHHALDGEHATDAHYVKGLRAIMVGSETWGGDEYWLKAAVRMAGEFDGWGFDENSNGHMPYESSK